VVAVSLKKTDLGVDSCIVGWFSRRKAKRVLRLPLPMEVVLLVVLGYRRGQHVIPARQRKKLEDIVSYESYGVNGEQKGIESREG
jgi:nitroreductase